MGCKELKASVYFQGLIDIDMMNIFHVRHQNDAMHFTKHKYGAYFHIDFSELFFETIA
jgi:hypothetical protein